MKKTYRLNIVITYPKNFNSLNFRTPLTTLLTHIAWLYRLDYSVDHNTDLFNDVESDFYGETDIVYFRSTSYTTIKSKELRNVLNILFNNFNTLGGVEVFYQLQKVLPKYPFPSTFYRPLNYPYIEHHKGHQTSLLVYADGLQEALVQE